MERRGRRGGGTVRKKKKENISFVICVKPPPGIGPSSIGDSMCRAQVTEHPDITSCKAEITARHAEH